MWTAPAFQAAAAHSHYCHRLFVACLPVRQRPVWRPPHKQFTRGACKQSSTPKGLTYQGCRYLFDYDAQLSLPAGGQASIYCQGAQLVLRAKVNPIVVLGVNATLEFHDCSVVSPSAFPDVYSELASTGASNSFSTVGGEGSSFVVHGGDVWIACEARSRLHACRYRRAGLCYRRPVSQKACVTNTD